MLGCALVLCVCLAKLNTQQFSVQKNEDNLKGNKKSLLRLVVQYVKTEVGVTRFLWQGTLIMILPRQTNTLQFGMYSTYSISTVL